MLIPYSYLKYVDLCSKALRACLKSELAVVASKRGESTLKYSVWENGKQGDLSKSIHFHTCISPILSVY